MTTSSKTNKELEKIRKLYKSWKKRYPDDDDYDWFVPARILSLVEKAKEAGREEERKRCRRIIMDSMSFYDTGMECGEMILQELHSK